MKTKAYLIFLFLFLGSTYLYSQNDKSNSRIVRILTYNIYHGATMKGDFDLNLIANVIKQTNPHLVALQEVDFKTKRAKGLDLASELGARTNMISLFGRAMHYSGGEYGEAILSSLSLISSRNNPLPFTGENEPRCALEVVTVLASGDTIAFIGTHLDHTSDEGDRVLQANKINELLSKIRYPVILAGDLNAEPDSNPINILEEKWGIEYDKNSPAPTYPSTDPAEKIDYVMFYPKNRWKILSSEVICDKIASDHCALLVVLELLY
jgi:endonuclease/exonuclease/phosphatase family metal-dependent hydrolase